MAITTDLVDPSRQHDLAAVSSDSQPVSSASDSSVAPDEETLPEPEELEEPPKEGPITPTPHKDPGSHITPSPPTTHRRPPSIVVHSPDSAVATEGVTTPLKELAVGIPTPPQSDDGKSDDDHTILPVTPIKRGRSIDRDDVKKVVEEIVEASTLCQEDLVVGVPSSFTPVARSSKIDLDMSAFSDVETPSTPASEAAEDSPAASYRSQSPSPTRIPTVASRPRSLLESQREFVFTNLIDKLKNTWRLVLLKCAWRLGSHRAVNTHFEPDINIIRCAAMRPLATLQEIADVVELAMVAQWARCCRHTISAYRRDFRADLVRDALLKAQPVKQKVLADAMLLLHPAAGGPLFPMAGKKRVASTAPDDLQAQTTRSTSPCPSPDLHPATPRKSNMRDASTQADVLQTQEELAQLNIHDPNDDDDKRFEGYTASPTSASSKSSFKRLRKPTRIPPNYRYQSKSSQSRARAESPAKRQRVQSRPRRAPAPSPKPSRLRPEVVGHIGPYAVTSPACSRRGSSGSQSDGFVANDAMEMDGDVFL
ncbi:hypothetical protein F4821DRAFT_231715 [Hypoxylon rubiginosum]|uniref:Uncharacterized protein n=1 Tax=Hypoxylon rubiginosum TaxID=110542 RepID=A0ACC0D9Y1_9PEZI|nr:hypothetical protein F4821DRAFT_231715 [Hypoxylon rubiginosum]